MRNCINVYRSLGFLFGIVEIVKLSFPTDTCPYFEKIIIFLKVNQQH